MRLQTIEPAYFYADLDECAYSCECGQSATIYIQATETRRRFSQLTSGAVAKAKPMNSIAFGASRM
jgi:hypothetical protein